MRNNHLSILFHHGALVVNGSFVLTTGYLAMPVNVAPNLVFTRILWFNAQPLAFKTGARLRLRNFSHAIIIAGPEIIKMIAANIITQ